MIYTFYSYKGGVGRSMSLANVAELMYQKNLKVLMIDFDLEAPGLEKYFQDSKVKLSEDEIMDRRGLIDMLISYQELYELYEIDSSAEVREESQTSMSFKPEAVLNFIIPVYAENSRGGSLSLISAGRRLGDCFAEYVSTVNSFDWEEFYTKWHGERFFNWFLQEVNKQYDAILIDSRTGISEMGGVCTYHLADAVVLFTATNEQNLDGIGKMAQSLSQHSLIENGRKGRPLFLLFVPSRVDGSEAERLDKFAIEFNRQCTAFIPQSIEIKKSLFIDFKVPYIPYYSYEEKVAVREPNRASAEGLISAFEKLSIALSKLAPMDSLIAKTFADHKSITDTTSVKKSAAKIEREFVDLKEVLDNSSDKNRNFLIAFLLLTIYSLTSILSVSDNALFLNTFNLSIFNLQLHSTVLSLAIPFVLLAFHANLLINLKEHNSQLTKWVEHELNEPHNFSALRPYLYNIWGKYRFSRGDYTAIDYQLLRFIIVLVFSFLPLSTLLFFFWRMASMQDIWLSIWQFACVVGNAILQIYYWPVIECRRSKPNPATANLPIAQFRWLYNVKIPTAIAIMSIISVGRLTLLFLAIYFPMSLRPILNSDNAAWLVPRINLPGLQSVDVKDKLESISKCSVGQYPKLDLRQRNFNLINLESATLCNADFSRAKLQGAVLTDGFFSGNFSLTDLSFANFSRSNLNLSRFTGAKLDNSDFRFTNAKEVDFSLANLQRSFSTGADFSFASFIQSNLEEASFTSANLTGSKLIGANLNRAKFTSSNIEGVDIRFVKDFDGSLSGAKNESIFCIVDGETVLANLAFFRSANCKVSATGREQRAHPVIAKLQATFDVEKFENINQGAISSNEEVISNIIAAIALSRSESIDLSNLALKTLPSELLSLNYLKQIKLNNNQLDSGELTLLFELLPQLIEIELKNNLITQLPHNIGNLQHVRTLLLSNNQLAMLPQEVSRLVQLEVLDLSGNNLIALPSGFEQLKRLKLLKLSDNPMTVLPEELLDLQPVTKFK